MERITVDMRGILERVPIEHIEAMTKAFISCAMCTPLEAIAAANVVYFYFTPINDEQPDLGRDIGRGLRMWNSFVMQELKDGQVPTVDNFTLYFVTMAEQFGPDYVQAMLIGDETAAMFASARMVKAIKEELENDE